MLLGSFVPGNESAWERNVPVPCMNVGPNDDAVNASDDGK